MGANLNRLMQSYGVYTPTVSPYTGVDTPDALKAGATAGERGTYQGSLADYAAQQDAFKGYERDYRNRIATTDLYTNPGPASTFLSTPNYSGIRGMRANLSDTTSADTTDYTNPNFDSMINDAYRSIGRVGIGTDTSNIDQAGYDYWKGRLQAGANGGIAPGDFKNQFKIATNDYIRQKPDDDYTKYVQGYLGILPATTLPVLPATGGGTTLGKDVDPGMGEGSGASPGSGYDGGATGTPASDAAQAEYGASLGSFGDVSSASSMADYGGVGAVGLARGGPVNSPTSMEEALLSDRSRHEFSDPRFEELYGKYFYADGGGVGVGAHMPQLTQALDSLDNNPGNLPRVTDGGENDRVRRLRQAYPLQPMYTGDARVLDSSAAAELGASLGSSGDFSSSVGNPDDLMSLQYRRDLSRLGRADRSDREVESDATAAELGASLGSFGDVPSSVGNPDDMMSLEDQRGKYRGTYATPPALAAPLAGATQSAPAALDAIKRNREALDAYRKGLTEQSSIETDPDAVDKWLRLAAAFLKPTKTGKNAALESFANAAESEVVRRKEETLRKTAEKNKRDEMGLKGLALNYKLTHDEVLAQREDERERNKALLAIRLKSMDSPKGVEAADIHMLLNGDPSSRAYAAAYARQGATRVMSNGTEVSPNMNWAEVPTFKLNSNSAGGENNFVNPAIVTPLKPIPQAVMKGMIGNISSITQIDQTLQELENTQGSGVGFVEGNLPGPIADRINSKGVRLRAMIADIGSMKLHDRSGAAVTAAEFPRLRPFIPSPADNPETIRKKLNQFRDQYLNELRDQRSAYSSGYKPVDAVDDILKKNEPRPESDNIITFGRNGERISK